MRNNEFEEECYKESTELAVKTNETSGFGIGLVIFALFSMIFLYAVLLDLNYGKAFEEIFPSIVVSVLGLMIAVSLITQGLCWLFEIEYSINELTRFTLLILLFIWLDSTFFESIGLSYMNEKNYFWCYDFITLVVNGIYILLLSSAIEKEMTGKNIIRGLYCLMAWNLLIDYVASNKPIAYQVSLVFTNVLIFAAVVFTSNVKNKIHCNGNRFVICIIYFIAQLFLNIKNEMEYVNFYGFSYSQPEWEEYVESVHMIFQNSNWLGSAGHAGIYEYVVSALQYNTDPILSISWYWGKFFAILYFLVLVVLMIYFARVLFRVKEERIYFIVGMSAYANLLVRMVFGTLLSFGLVPIAISLPFMSRQNYLIDYCSCAVLLVASFKLWGKRNRFMFSIDIIDIVLNLICEEDGDGDENEKDEY